MMYLYCVLLTLLRKSQYLELPTICPTNIYPCQLILNNIYRINIYIYHFVIKMMIKMNEMNKMKAKIVTSL